MGSSLPRECWARSPHKEVTQAIVLEYTDLLAPNQDLSPERLAQPQAHLVERLVETLIIQAAGKGLKLLAKLSCVRRHGMDFERLLILPYFHDRTMVLPTVLLPYLKAHIAGFLAARLGQLLSNTRLHPCPAE